ncbi:2OG-Fe(II) oxygenase [Pseudomonas gingeri]|uniref:2OG-Fe(II) oxygenase n=1 Tax=Pseudomonas TaxID=286 RepID=UPI0015A46E7E|nr:2OG-Fe(II) oxygenase [Pseudomonas gingeri]NWE46036.1 2OG-Fe(II) oxygenase [Pseudomonas gingeri]NWE68723.1 2OG-Fe(II) oxygenase [Pseudomonas gingeri]
MDAPQIAALIVERLTALSADIQNQWNNPEGTHTRHFIIDELLSNEMAQQIYDAFPRNADGFFDRQSFREKKKTLGNLADHPEILSSITFAMQHPSVVGKIADLVAIEGILPDPTLYAGGLSMMFKDDFLNPHIDNSHDAARALYRRLNLLYYVAPDWRLENGGNFELWDPQVKTQKTLVSKFNRLVVMETNKDSWHSVSKVRVEGPRCCVSNYYFSEESPDDEDKSYFHVTSFNGRPEEPGRRALGVVDNTLRNAVSKLLRVGRGKDQAGKPKS